MGHIMEGILTHSQTILEKYGTVSGRILDTSAKDIFGEIATPICKDTIGMKSTPMTSGNVKTGSDIWTNYTTSITMGLGRSIMTKNKNRRYPKRMKMRKYLRNGAMKFI